jgi:hypothetical protein
MTKSRLRGPEALFGADCNLVEFGRTAKEIGVRPLVFDSGGLRRTAEVGGHLRMGDVEDVGNLDNAVGADHFAAPVWLVDVVIVMLNQTLSSGK